MTDDVEADVDVDSTPDHDSDSRSIETRSEPAAPRRSWRPVMRAWRTELAASGVALLAVAICGVSIEVNHHSKASHIERTIADLRDDIQGIEVDVEADRDRYNAANAKLESARRRNGPLFDRAEKLNEQHTSLKRQVAVLRKRVSALVEVPDVGGVSETDAQTRLEAAGLSSVTELIDGTCADYQGHFIDRGFGWWDVVRQETRPGTRVVSGTEITLVLFDSASNWELGCNDDEFDL